MNLVGWNRIETFFNKYTETKTLFEEWREKVRKSQPRNTADFKSQIGHNPDFLDATTVVFNFNSHRLCCKWLGTNVLDDNNEQILIVDDGFPMIHKDYDKWSKRWN